MLSASIRVHVCSQLLTEWCSALCGGLTFLFLKASVACGVLFNSLGVSGNQRRQSLHLGALTYQPWVLPERVRSIRGCVPSHSILSGL